MPVKKRAVSLSVIPGQPLDGTGRVCIHLFVPDQDGPFVEPSVMGMHKEEGGADRLTTGPVRGRLACDTKRVRAVSPTQRGNRTNVTMRTDDPRAVTCPKCVASPQYAELMAVIARA